MLHELSHEILITCRKLNQWKFWHVWHIRRYIHVCQIIIITLTIITKGLRILGETLFIVTSAFSKDIKVLPCCWESDYAARPRKVCAPPVCSKYSCNYPVSVKLLWSYAWVTSCSLVHPGDSLDLRDCRLGSREILFSSRNSIPPFPSRCLRHSCHFRAPWFLLPLSPFAKTRFSKSLERIDPQFDSSRIQPVIM